MSPYFGDLAEWLCKAYPARQAEKEQATGWSPFLIVV